MSSITTHRPLTRSLASLVFVLLLLAPLAGAPAAARNKHALAYPPNAKVAGKTYGEWAAAWWQWAFSIPAADHPLLVDSLAAGDRCDVDQPKQVFLPGGVFNVSGEAERSCTIRPGTTLFFPILNFEADNYLCVNPDTNFEVSDLRDLAKSNIDTATNLALEVDGKAVDMSRNRFTSPTFAVTLPEDNLLQAVGCADALPETYQPIVDDGYYVALHPLPPGKHTIHFHGTLPDFGFTLDITYHLTVKPKG